MRILNGISPVSLQSTRYLSDALEKLGHKTDIVIYKPSKVLLNFEDVNLNIDLSIKWKYPIYAIKILGFFLSSLIKYDVFHFHFGHSLLPRNIDLFFLKLFKKKIFMEYHGTDIRRKTLFSRHSLSTVDIGISESESYLKQKRIARFVSGIIVHDLELKEHLFDFNYPVYMLPLRLDINRFSPKYPLNVGRLNIVHSPTSPHVKGTEMVKKAIRNLSAKYDINFQLLVDLPNSELQTVFENADIIIDQLVIGTYGMLSIESMALGKPVICYLREDLFAESVSRPPIHSANINNIEDRLEELISNFQLRYQLGIAGRKFVEQYHSSQRMAEIAEGIYLK